MTDKLPEGLEYSPSNTVTISVSKAEHQRILTERERRERDAIIAEIHDRLGFEKSSSPGHEFFGNIAERLCIETLRDLLAGVKSREQRNVAVPYLHVSRYKHSVFG